MKWWWLSFAGKDGFRGVSIVPGGDIIEAVRNATTLECNPHGEVLGIEIPNDIEPHIDEKWRGRVLTREEALEVEHIGAERRLP